MQRDLFYIWTIAKNAAGQRKKVLIQMVNHAVFLVFVFLFYRYIYKITPALQERIPLANALWSMAVYYIVFWLSLRRIEQNMRKEILSGVVEVYLLRPMSYVYQKILAEIGNGIVPCIFATVLSVGMTYFLVGLPDVGMSVGWWVVTTILLFLVSQVMVALTYTLCGLAAFWMTDSEPVSFIVSKLTMILGGAWVPVAFFPHWMQLVAQYSPFGGTVAIAFAMYPNYGTQVWYLFGNCVFWILVLGFLVHIVSRRALKRLAVNG